MSMNCPACKRELTPIQVGKVLLDACEGGCGGVWFDNFELEHFDENSEEATTLLEIKRDPAIQVDETRKRRCPRCEAIVMRRFFFSVEKEIEADQCAQCGGDWLDGGELARIRGEFEDAAAREEAAESYFGQLFDQELALQRAESQRNVARAKKFSYALRYLCPSYYIPGKQDGAAF